MLEHSGQYRYNWRKSFIFSISNKEELDPFVAGMKRVNVQVHWFSPVGPCFVRDIKIVNNANSYNNSLARLDEYYPAPAAVQNPNTILAGTEYFSPDEVEVFYLDPTQ